MISAAAAKRVKLIGFDVDGVLTDAGLYLGDVGGKPVELKRYNSQDGLAMNLLRLAGIKLAIVTGRVSVSVRMRATELKVDELVQDARARKLPAFQRILRKHAVDAADAAFVGDDVPDLDVMRLVGLPVAVANCTSEVRGVARVHLEKSGGQGAIREFTQLLLTARGDWDAIVEQYLAERSGRKAAAGPGESS